MQIGQTGVFQAAPTSINEPVEAAASRGSRTAEATANTLPQDTTSFSTAPVDASSVVPADGLFTKALVQQTLAAGSARTARVEGLRQSVDSGSYVLDAGSIADAMIRNTV